MGEVWGLGSTLNKQLGTQIETSATITPVRVGNQSNFQLIKSAYFTNYGIKNDGSIWGIGDNNKGALGVGVSGGEWVQLSGDTDWVECVTGQNHVIARKSNGTIWGRGSNGSGQLEFAVQVSGTSIWRQLGASRSWKAIAAGVANTLAVTVSGNVYAVGANDLNQSGANPTTPKTTFTFVSNGTNVNKIVSGDTVSWILKNDGTIWALGRAALGSTGPDIANNKSVYTQLGTDTDWVDIQKGFLSLYAKKSDDTWWGIGYNGGATLGVSAPSIIPFFIRISAMPTAIKMEGGATWTWALQ